MSVNAVDQTTGNTTPLAGNTNNLVGNLSALTTNTKSDAVGAINEVNQTKQNATDNNLQTTNKTIVGGINELVSGLTNLVKRGTVDVTIASGATTGSAYLRVDTVIIARDRMVGVLIGKNDDVYYNPVIISVHNDGAIEARVVGDAPTTSRTYNVIVSYI